MALKFNIETIPHGQHRYPTVGDYWDEGDVKHVRVSDLADRRHEILVAIHELVESFLCDERGIPEPLIKAFDEEFERQNKPGEPGDDPQAPYRREHRFAENIERAIAHELGVDWNEYEKSVDDLWHPRPAIDTDIHRWADDGGISNDH